MMEILFRGKPVECNRRYPVDKYGFIHGWYCPTPFGSWPLTPAIYPAELAENGEWKPVEIEPETVGQYTGIKDKDDRKIFTGDIVQATIRSGSCDGFRFPVGVAELQNGAFGISDKHDRFTQFYAYAPTVEIEIVGNIYDNTNPFAEEET